MATRRRRTTTRRRRNPARTTGMLLVNPRRKRAKRKTRRAPARRRRTTTKRRASRRRNPVARRRAAPRRRKTTARRRNPARRRSTRRRKPVRRRRNSSGGGAPLVVRRRNPRRRRRATSRRRNPSRRRKTRRRNPSTSIAKMFKKIPVIGPILANAVGLGTYSILGAVSIEPVMALVKLAAPWFPMVPASAFYAGAGLVAAALVPFLPYFSKATKDKLALSMASAAGGVAYYKWRTGQDIEVATEAAVVEMAGAGFGGLIPGPSSGMYTPPQAVDAAYSGGGGVWQVGGGPGGAY